MAVVVGVIPARYGAQRLPAKPLVDLLGKPMIQHVYEQARKAGSLHRVVVATDDTRIESAVKQFGGEVVMTSPQIPSGSDRVAAVARTVEGDVFVNIQGDEPLIDPRTIDQAVNLMLSDPQAAVATLAVRLTSAAELQNPGVVKVVLGNEGYALYFSRSPIPFLRDEPDVQRWPERYICLKHLGLYVFRRESLEQFTGWGEGALERAERLEQLRFLEHGSKIRVGITTLDSVPIDTADDVARVLHLMKQRTQ